MSGRAKRSGFLLLAILAGGAIWATFTVIHRGERNRDLIAAINKNDLNTVRVLLDRGADPNARESWVAELRQPNLLDHLGALRWHSFSALMLATARGNPAMLHLLLKRGAQVNAREDRFHSTALSMAAMYGRVDCARILLDAGADPNARDEIGATALITTAQNGDFACVQLLVARGANIHLRMQNGYTALWLARRARRAPVVAFLKRMGAKE